MINQNLSGVEINSIRLHKSNSEANHTNKKNNQEDKKYQITKKNKMPRGKIFLTNHNTKQQKQKSHINFHNHVSSNISPFCIRCGTLTYFDIKSNQLIESIKPHNYYYSPEFSINSMLTSLRKKTDLEYRQIFFDFKTKNTTPIIISFRSRIINTYFDYSKKILINKNTIYLAILLMDILILKKNITITKKLEQISLGCYYLAVKFIDLAENSFDISEFQYTNELASSYSVEQIRKIETYCIVNLQHNLGITNFINVIQLFLANGILFKNDLKTTNSEQSMKNIYYLINKISENIICDDMKYIQYNQFNLACAILYLSRNISKLEPWPMIYVDLYNIKLEDFSEEYNYVNSLNENNFISNFRNKKRHRNNSTCKNINIRRICFNSTFNNNKTTIMNGDIKNKNNNNDINDNKENKNISNYNYKLSSNHNYNNDSLICDTASNYIDYYTNNDSSKKINNYSGRKINSKLVNPDNNSNQSVGDNKDKLLNSSSKYIRTHHKLIKNNHQIAFNQSMEMPRNTYIFQNRIYHSKNKKIENENKINSNRSQKREKNNNYYKLYSNKSTGKYIYDYNYDRDTINKDEYYIKGRKKIGKMYKFQKIQIKRKNNSQSNLFSANVKKSSSSKLKIEKPKRTNLSSNSNGKHDYNYLVNNNYSAKKITKKENNINYYYSNIKVKNKEGKKSYIYNNKYKSKKNNSSTTKKEYDNISKEHKEISANYSFITITDTYNLNSQKKKLCKKESKIHNIKIIDKNIKKNEWHKDIDTYQNKNVNEVKHRLSHIKYNSCINTKNTKINLYEDKSFNNNIISKKEINTSHKEKNIKEININNQNNHNFKNYYTNIIFNKNGKSTMKKGSNIIIKINLLNKKFDINRNHLFQKNVKKNSSNEGINMIKHIKINNNNNARRKENSKRKRIDSNVSSYHHKNNNSNNNSSLIMPNNRSTGKNNSDSYKHTIKKNYNNFKNNERYKNVDKRGRNFSMLSTKKLKSSNSLL